jgi:hypothetical protein
MTLQLFFAPSLGLANLLMHWKMGRMKSDSSKNFDAVDGNITRGQCYDTFYARNLLMFIIS